MSPGDVFDLLTVVSLTRLPASPSQAVLGRLGPLAALCRCTCGKYTNVRRSDLLSRHTTSCGCRKRHAAVGANRGYVGLSTQRTQEYYRWSAMMNRCYNPSHQSYPNYGGRGIRVDMAWHSVENYINYVDSVLGPCPTGYTLDRINNDASYGPGNVRWATHSEQALNRRKP